jgi:hypothetical protein
VCSKCIDSYKLLTRSHTHTHTHSYSDTTSVIKQWLKVDACVLLLSHTDKQLSQTTIRHLRVLQLSGRLSRHTKVQYVCMSECTCVRKGENVCMCVLLYFTTHTHILTHTHTHTQVLCALNHSSRLHLTKNYCARVQTDLLNRQFKALGIPNKMLQFVPVWYVNVCVYVCVF